MFRPNATPAVNEKTHVPLPRYIIKEVKSPYIPKNHKLRIGITGVCEQAPSEGTGYVWRDPAIALKEVLPELRKQADVVVVLAYLPLDQAKALAAELEGIDVMVVGHTQPSLLTLETVGNTAVVVNNYETKALGSCVPTSQVMANEPTAAALSILMPACQVSQTP